MRIDERFEMRYGHSLELNRLTPVELPLGVNFVGRAAVNNGVTARVTPPRGLSLGRPGEITVSLNGQGGALASYVQPTPFITGYHVMILSPIDITMPTAERIWWARCIWENHYRYGFGRQANRTLASLQLPDEAPPWVRSAAEPSPASVNIGLDASDLYLAPPRASGEFVRVDELFDVRYGHSLELNRLTKKDGPNSVNFVGRSAVNNGVTARIELPAGVHPGVPGEITVALGGSVLSTFVQPAPFVCGRDSAILRPLDSRMSFGERFWWARCIAANHYRFSYGRQANRTLASLRLPSAIPSFVSEVYQRVHES